MSIMETPTEAVLAWVADDEMHERLMPPIQQPRTYEVQIETRQSLSMTANVIQTMMADELRDTRGYDSVIDTDRLLHNLLTVEKLRDLSMVVGPPDSRMMNWDRNTLGVMKLRWVADDTLKFLIVRALEAQEDLAEEGYGGALEGTDVSATWLGYRQVWLHLLGCQTAWQEMLERTSTGRYNPNMAEYWPVLLNDEMWYCVKFLMELDLNIIGQFDNEWNAFAQACEADANSINPIAITASMR